MILKGYFTLEGGFTLFSSIQFCFLQEEKLKFKYFQYFIILYIAKNSSF